MKIKDILLEKQILVDIEEFGHAVKVEEMPSLQRIIVMLKQAKQGGELWLRGYVDDSVPSGRYYCWNASDAIHGQVVRSLGIEYKNINRCDILINSMSDLIFDTENLHEKLSMFPVLARLQAGFDRFNAQGLEI